MDPQVIIGAARAVAKAHRRAYQDTRGRILGPDESSPDKTVAEAFDRFANAIERIERAATRVNQSSSPESQ